MLSSIHTLIIESSQKKAEASAHLPKPGLTGTKWSGLSTRWTVLQISCMVIRIMRYRLVSVAREKMEHGIIYNPLRNELFTATRGQGAQLDNRRIRVSGQTQLENSLVTVGYPSRDLPHFDMWIKCLDAVVIKSAGIRHTGSAALDLAYVACGRTDAYWEPQLKIWDVAAGSLIVREARGLVADFEGNQDFLESGNVICANPKLFNELLMLVKSNLGGIL